MISALLFDLDGTLLDSDMEAFMPPYFRLLAAKLAPLVSPQTLLPALIASSQVMMRNTDKSKTNKEVFWADFLPRIGCRLDDLLPLLDEFYGHDFAALRRYTAPRPEARPLMEAVFAAGYTVAIATQPVFPEPAVYHRLQWAGIADFPYALVTTYENMHTTKPAPDYYLEVCERIGHRPSVCLMVGNDIEADIRPAAAAGLRTFWLAGQEQPPMAGLPADYAGTLTDVQRLVESGVLRAG